MQIARQRAGRGRVQRQLAGFPELRVADGQRPRVGVDGLVDGRQVRLAGAAAAGVGQVLGGNSVLLAALRALFAHRHSAERRYGARDRRAISLRQFARKKGRDPISPQDLSHRRRGSRSRDQLIVFGCQHGRFLSSNDRPGQQLMVSIADRDVSCARSQWREAFIATGPLAPTWVQSSEPRSRVAIAPSSHTAISTS